jgi:hypothetical protein
LKEGEMIVDKPAAHCNVQLEPMLNSSCRAEKTTVHLQLLQQLVVP